ncbi:MAG TPA: antibiotic biosynthesis monooxygenase [Ktedonobacterales bacterium]|nr:antibiotic biosynthesis monooxygenase [Ktedonobacterales bacterium]
MYGTVAHARIKAGAEERLMAMAGEFAKLEIPGYRATYLYRMDSDPREIYMAVVFDSKEAYDRNAGSPEQDKRYRELLEMLEGEPEWHDGEITSDAAVPA